MDEADLGTVSSGVELALTLRTRVAFNLPVQYTCVYIEIRVEHLKKNTYWKTQKVPVIDGSALLDFWIRVPGKKDGTTIKFKASIRIEELGTM